MRVDRYFDGKYAISFPQFAPKATVTVSGIKSELTTLATVVERTDPLKSEGPLKSEIVDAVNALAEPITQDWTAHELDAAIETLKALLPDQPAKTSTIVPRVQQTVDVLTEWSSHIRSPAPEDIEGVRDIVLKALPTFVYYSNYGNLD
ncbi:hypothetical protein NCPPB3923_17400 [Burkholderia glumae]|nr:hypothetical protein NCPPB3923_17400 [Burkholderia glumae]